MRIVEQLAFIEARFMIPKNVESQPNPFEPPTFEIIRTSKSALGSGFWYPLILSFCLNGAFCFSSSLRLLGAFGIFSSVFAMLRGLLIRTRARQAESLALPYEFKGGSQQFVTSFVIGVVASITSSIAFVATCYPLMIAVVNLPVNVGYAYLILIFFVSPVVAMFAGFGLIRLTIPAVPKP